MMRWIIQSSLALRYLVLVFAAALIVFGLTQLGEMPVDVFPEFDPPLVEVQTEALGLSAAEMEALITVPLEADLLNGVAWLDQIYSESVAGLSSILLVFEPGTDPIRARQMVQERLTQTFALPNVSKPPTMLQPLSTTSRVMMVGLSSDELSLIDMGVLARWVIKPRLMGVPGVANVAIWGQREWQLQVQVDPEQLQATGVSLQQVIETTGEALWVSPLSYLESSTPGTAGWIDTPNQRLSLRHQLPISSAQDLAQVPVKGTAWRLGEVAQVVEDHQPLIGDAVLNQGPGLLLVIEKFPRANTLEVTQDVEEALEAMRPGLSGIEIDPTIFRPANYIQRAATNIGTTLLISLVLAAIVLAVFHFEWRAALVSLAAMLISLLVAVLILHLRGATFNMMTLVGLAIALGIIVDEAVVGVENAARRLRQRHRGEHRASAASIISEAMLEVRAPMGFATLILLLAVLPVFFLEGLTAPFYRPLATSYVFSIFAALAVALIITPTLSLSLLSDAAAAPRKSPLLHWLQRAYSQILSQTMKASGPIMGLTIVTVLLGLAVIPFLPPSSLPDLRQTELRIEIEAAAGTSRAEMIRIMARAGQELQAIPGVLNVGSHVGRAITGDAVVGIHSGEIWVSLDPLADYPATLAAIQGVIDGYPGLLRQAQSYLPERLWEALTGPQHDLVVRIYGHDFDLLRSKAQEVSQALSSIDGVGEVQVEAQIDRPQVEIEVDLAAAQRYQVKPGDVRRAAATLLSGLQVGNLYEEQKVFDVVVWGVPEIRNSLSDIRRLLIDTPRGGHVRLGEVADVRIAPAPVTIRRDAVSRFIDVTADVRGRALSSVAADVEDRLDQIDFPVEYHAELLGRTLTRQAAGQRIFLISAVAGIGIFLLLQAAFNSWRLALVTLISLPVALVGGLLAAFLDGGPFSFASIFGLLAVLGISVRSALLMMSHFKHLEQDEGGAFGMELVVRGARERLASNVMTALITGLAFLALLIVGDRPGTEILRPTAVVVLGGLITSTAVTLFITPWLYWRFGPSPAPEEARLPAGAQPGFTS